MFNYKPIPYFCEIKSRTIKVHDVSWWLPNLQLQTLLCVSGSKHKAFGKQMVHEKHKLFQVFAPFCWSMKYEKCQGLHPRQVSQAEPRKSNNICFAPHFLTVLILIFCLLLSLKVNQASHIEDLKSSSIENYVRIISS